MHTPRSSANGMNHTCLCLPSRSWYSFTDPGEMEGWVGLVCLLSTYSENYRWDLCKHFFTRDLSFDKEEVSINVGSHPDDPD